MACLNFTAFFLEEDADPIPSTLPTQYLINHFLDVNVTILGSVYPVPARNALQSTNGLTGLSSLPAQSSACFGQHGYIPTFTLVDYFDVGNVFRESLLPFCTNACFLDPFTLLFWCCASPLN